MKYLYFIFKSAFDDFRKNKIRTFLTTLGILIGIFSVVLLTSLGLGFKKYMEDQFRSLGTNLVMIMPGKMENANVLRLRTSMMNLIFDEKDINNLRKNKNIINIAPIVSNYSELKGALSTEIYEFIGSNQEIFTIMNGKIDTGTLFNRGDVEKRNKVVVLGSKPAEKLYGSSKNALGKLVKIDDISYKVIGVLQEQGGGFGTPSIDDHVYAPYKSVHFRSQDKFLAIYAKVKEEKLLDKVKQEIYSVLVKRYSQDDFSILDQQEMLDIMGIVFDMINIVLIAIAAISLVVGGVGIMNIMFVSVYERIHEIGIRRAFGAYRKDILMIFLVEAVILSLIGGIIGLTLTYLTILSIKNIFPAYIDIFTVILALTVSSAIGILFGILPAKKAADLTPVEAMRYE